MTNDFDKFEAVRDSDATVISTIAASKEPEVADFVKAVLDQALAA